MSTHDQPNRQGLQNETINDLESDSDDCENFIPTSQPFRTNSSGSLVLPTKKKIVDETAELDESLFTIDETIPLESSCLVPDTQDVLPSDNKSCDFIPSSEMKPMKNINLPLGFMDPPCKKKLEVDNSEENNSSKTTPDDEMLMAETQLFTPKDIKIFHVGESPSFLESQNASIIENSPGKSEQEDNCSVTTLFTNSKESSPKPTETSKKSVTEICLSDSSKEEVSSHPLQTSKGTDDEVSILLSRCESPKNNHFKKPEKKEDDIAVVDIPFRYSDMTNSLNSDHDCASKQEIFSYNNSLDTSSSSFIRSNVSLDSTMDANEVEYHPSPSENCWSGGNLVPSVTVPESDINFASNDTEEADEDKISRFEKPSKVSLIKSTAKVQNHSTPESSNKKLPKINESASSIENITMEEVKNEEISLNFNLTISCQITLHGSSRRPISKIITKVKESINPKPIPRKIWANPAHKHSSSSSESVFSDKTGLPYTLQPRFSGYTSSSGSVDVYDDRIKAFNNDPWVNEQLVPTTMDDLLPKAINDYFRNVSPPNSKSSSKEKITASVEKSKVRVLQEQFSANKTTESSSLESSSSSKKAQSDLETPNNKEVKQDVQNPMVTSDIEDLKDDESLEHVATPENVEDSIEVDESDDRLQTGLRVFARWSDKRYYSGKLHGSSKYDRWDVKFDDNTTKTVREDFIIPRKWLGKGQLVFALVHDKYEPGKVVDVKPGKNGVYKVELDNSNDEVDVKASDLYLTDDMVNILKEDHKTVSVTPARKRSADIDFDNVVSGKRVRELRTPDKGTSPVPNSSRKKKKPATKLSPVTESKGESNKKNINDTPGPSGIRTRSSEKSKGKPRALKLSKEETAKEKKTSLLQKRKKK